MTLRSRPDQPASGDATADGFAGAVAIVTGAASGLGLATARRLRAAGASVVLADRDTERGAAAADELGGTFVACDVTDAAANEALVADTLRAHDRLDLMVLNAGIEGGGPVGAGFDPARYRAVMAVNTDGVAYGLAAALPALVRSGGAAVAVASLAGLAAIPADPVYGASKHAVVGLIRALGPVYAPQGVTVNAVCPGFADTPLIAAFRDAFLASGFPLLEADDVAAAVLSAALSQGVGECWVVQPGREPAPYGFRGVPGARRTDGTPATFPTGS